MVDARALLANMPPLFRTLVEGIWVVERVVFHIESVLQPNQMRGRHTHRKKKIINNTRQAVKYAIKILQPNNYKTL